MKFEDRVAHQARATRGRVKKLLGKATGSARLQSEGRREQFRGNLERAADKLRDAFRR
ncbi:CsbD family protein [Nocardia sp. NBC_00508]|uniref:CsbD family protein n=1 Tax=Nocardia sp. NBC_00508 TaxID=2975992 RepID=UPI002E80A20C|nr:CsbD family protein [Nocardia sp. NBC_00508]WUD68297.1 CsbD family protein [Nocardia sp. NBC_00508]